MSNLVIMPEYKRRRPCLADVALPPDMACEVTFIAHSPGQIRCPTCQSVRMAKKQKINFAKAKAKRKQAVARRRAEHPGLTPAQVAARSAPRLRIHL